MKDSFALLSTLERLFEGDRNSRLTLKDFLEGLHDRSYAFAILALDMPNLIPLGIPWLSTITGVPMVLLAVQYFAGREVPSLPQAIGRRGFPRGRLQDFLGHAASFIRWLERTVHVRYEWWVTGTARRLLYMAWAANIAILAVPIPFDNLLPAFAILFFCLALIEDDGAMAMLGWLFTALTALWTVFLLMAGHAAIVALLKALGSVAFGQLPVG